MSSIKVKNIVISGTNMWNPGDDFVRDGVIKILRELFADFQLNFLFYNFNQDFFLQNKFPGISNMAAKGDLDQYRNSIDAVVIAGLSAGTEIKNLYTWVIQNKLHDRVFLIGAGYENSYVERCISEEPEATIFKNARIITGRTRKTPRFISKLNLPYHHINCPALLSVPDVKHVPPGNKISRIGLSLQLPHKQGIPNHCCSKTMYDLCIEILLSLKTKYEVEVIAHHKSEYFHFINLLKKQNIPVIFSSFYQDLFNIYSRYDLMVTTRLHASLFANGFGIPGIIINDTERHTHCLGGFPHSVCVNTRERFDRAFESLRHRRLCDIATEAKQFKAQLLETYLDTLAGPFGLTRSRPALLNRDRLNVGCGLDYRDGFVNVDGNAQLAKVDHVVEIRPGALLRIFPAGHFRHVLAKDFLEHHTHWEARELLEDFRALLRPGGVLELYLPNIEVIINDPKKDIREKKTWLYGGQDIRQSGEPESSDLPRHKYPEYFCHKYGWIPEELRKELSTVGFEAIEIEVNDGSWNMHVRALKSKSSSRQPFDAGSAKFAAAYKFDSERKEQVLIRQLVQPGMTVLDVGANIGKYSKLFSLLVGKSGKVFAFEPDPASARRIEEIALRDNLENVILVKQAVCECTGKATLNRFPAEHSSWNSLGRTQMEDPLNPKQFVSTVGLVEVETVTLDGFCRAQDISQIDYLKLDIEGAELRALQGARELLAKRAIRHLQFEVSPKMIEGLNTSTRPVFDLLATHGYECRTITADGRVGDVVKESSASYENYIAVPGKAAVRQGPVADMLPVHFFTIVLNGEPFIRHHIEVFSQLPFLWHWHIIEGVADLKHDTGWSLQFGGRISDELHRNGLSNDGTAEYLNDLARQYPENITIYRKPKGTFWDGKLEMVNAPLPSIQEECLLWQVDVDEFWISDQISNSRMMFKEFPEKMAAYYSCRFFVGPELIVTSRNTYGNQTRYEWLRTWRYQPGDRWSCHEPPSLCRRNERGQWIDLSRMDRFLHAETEARRLVFDHYAYATEQQLRFKELYYGYRGAVASWRSLQGNRAFPCLLKNYFPWVKDDAVVDRLRQSCPRPSSSRIKRILWVRTDSIGDNVLAASMLPRIHESYPEAEISVICQEHVKPLFEANPCVGKIISINKRKAYRDHAYVTRLSDQLADTKFDLALNSIFSREPISDFLTFASRAPVMVAFEGDLCNIRREERDHNNRYYTLLIKEGMRENEIQRHRIFLAALDIRSAILEPEVWLTREDEQVADAFWSEQGVDSARAIGLFIGAQNPVRTCPSFGEALARVRNQQEIHVIAFGTAKDYGPAQRMLESIGGRVTNLCGRTSLRQTAALLKRCRLGVGVETGAAHMACAVGTSNVVLTGGGHFGRFLPYTSLTSLVCLPLDCFGCDWRCRYTTAHCTRSVLPQALAEAVSVALREPSTSPRLYLQNPADWIDSTGRPSWRWPIPDLPLSGVDVRISDARISECHYTVPLIQHA